MCLKWVLPFVTRVGKLNIATTTKIVTKINFIVKIFWLIKLKSQLHYLINNKILNLKITLVTILATVAILSLPLLVSKGNTHFKHALEWNYFVGVVLFYLLSRMFWRRTT